LFKNSYNGRNICEMLTLNSDVSVFRVANITVFQNIDQNSSCSFN
jgi:hypothetical protein